MARIPVNDCFRDPAQKFMHHDCFVFLRHAVKGLLDYMAAERIHAEAQSVTLNSIRNCDDLLRSSVFETTLDKEVSESIHHERVSLLDDGFDDVEFLLCCADFELLLQEYRGLLVIVANNLVDYVFPITRNILI